MDFWIFFGFFGFFLDFLDYLDFLDFFEILGFFEFFEFSLICFCFFRIPFKVTKGRVQLKILVVFTTKTGGGDPANY